jgi:hypothetical protein
MTLMIGLLDNWKVTRNFSWEDQSRPCYNGSEPALWQVLLQRLGIRIDGQGCYTEIIPANFQLHLIKDMFEFDMTMPESMNMDRGYLFAICRCKHAYGVKILGNEISIGKGIADAAPIPNSTSTYPFVANSTYHLRNEIGATTQSRFMWMTIFVIDTIDIPPFLNGGTIGFNGSVIHSHIRGLV